MNAWSLALTLPKNGRLSGLYVEDYTRDEPLGWTDFYIARGRALAAFGRGKRDESTMKELQRLHDEAKFLQLKVAIKALEEALAST